ncbi:MAG: ATP synthase F1 subunit delta [Candidatus Omnitrophica bacterium]|nr:ATP synthase F1 subunit delta [Candidatus Omnitrophota bacterium]
MKDSLIAKRYAEAYIEFAVPKSGLPRCVSDMKDLRSVFRQNTDLMTFLRAPEISKLDKARIIDKALSGILSAETITFVNYLLDKNRIDLLLGVIDHVRIAYSHGDVVDVVLRTTFPLELDIVERIKESVAIFAKKKVNLYLQLDPDLLGGVQIMIGNTLIDGSVRNRLVQLKKQLLQSRMSA